MEQKNGLKYCPKCKQTKPVSAYQRDKTTKDGFCCTCKDCKTLYKHSVKGRVKHKIETKTCSCCHESLSVEEFSKNSGSIDGYYVYCKGCAKNKREKLKTNQKVYVEYKQCSWCKELKYRDDFHNYRRAKDGLYHWCKKCQQENSAARKDLEKVTPQEFKICRVCKKSKHFTEFSKNSRAKDGLRYECNECTRKHTHIWRSNNIEKRREYKNNRYNTNLNFKLGCLIRGRVNAAIKNGQKAGSAVRDLGCTIPELIKYFESKFSEGMTWENHGYNGWHIDHVVPLSRFDLTDREQFLKACHYTNLQPMWAMDNWIKQGNLENEDV